MPPSASQNTPQRVYLDANVFIYALEAATEHLPDLTALFDLLAAGGAAAVTSELTLAEVLPRPVGRTSPPPTRRC